MGRHGELEFEKALIQIKNKTGVQQSK